MTGTAGGGRRALCWNRLLPRLGFWWGAGAQVRQMTIYVATWGATWDRTSPAVALAMAADVVTHTTLILIDQLDDDLAMDHVPGVSTSSWISSVRRCF